MSRVVNIIPPRNKWAKEEYERAVADAMGEPMSKEAYYAKLVARDAEMPMREVKIADNRFNTCPCCGMTIPTPKGGNFCVWCGQRVDFENIAFV